MPCDYKNYPDDWKAVSLAIRVDRAGGQCECTGECGLHRHLRCGEMNGEPAIWANGTIILTVAHLDYDGGPCTCKADTGKKCANPEHLKAMCQRCHLRMDMPHHKRNAARTRMSRKAVGSLFEEESHETRAENPS